MTSPLRLPPLPTISEIVKLYKLRAVKQLSQNFLLDKNIINKIVRSAGNLQNKFVIEVGPGPGGLTRGIIEAGCASVAVIEKDLRFMEGLQLVADSLIPPQSIQIHHANVLNLDLDTIVPPKFKTNWESDEANIHLMGNLPFNISIGLLLRLLKKVSEKKGLYSFGRVPMTLMFQKEVVERMYAPVSYKERSRLSVMCQYLCQVKPKLLVASTCFVPKPKVDAAVVQLIPYVEPKIKHNINTVYKVVTALFHGKTKHWIKTFRVLFPPDFKDFEKEIFQLKAIGFDKCAIDLDLNELNAICDFYMNQVHMHPDIEAYNYREKENALQLRKIFDL